MMPAWALVPLGLALLLAGICAGLYVGERGRRMMLERWVASGSPTPPPPAVVRDPREAEDRIIEREREISRETIDRAFEQESARLRAARIAFDPDELREDLKLMLHGQDVPE